jgi:folate-dependent phosphoribosylglycinamide formyltransferase PurN
MSPNASIAILISGGGRTAVNIHEACRDGRLRARVALVIAHRDDIGGVARCRDLGLRVAVLPTGDALAERVDACLAAAGTDLVCLAGYLRRFRVGSRWAGRTLNIHPALLPRFGGKGMYGVRVHEAVLAAGAQESGCTVHEVDEEYDHGATLVERRCPVLAGDTAVSLAERVYREELTAYPQAIAMMLERITRTQAAAGAWR